MDRKQAIGYIKERLSIVDVIRRYVDLKPNGARMAAPCPFHQETKPSFSVDEREGFFYCFGCQASGDIFKFYMLINGVDFGEALEQLALEAGIVLDPWTPQHGGGKNFSANNSTQNARQTQSLRQNMFRMYAFASAHFVDNLSKEDGQTCREYLEARKLSPEIVRKFSLGWAKNDWQNLSNALKTARFNEKEAVEAGLLGRSEKSGRSYDRFRARLIFPIFSLSNQIIAFGGRIIGQEDEAKYINSSDSLIYKKGDQLYGLAQSRKGISLQASVLLTEGYMDVLTLHQFGYDNAVGVLGTALTPEQIKRLSGFTSHIILLFDGDKAGRKAALRASEMILTRGLKCSVILLPEGEDIDSLLHNQGKEAFERLQAQASDAMSFCLSVLRNMAPKEAIDWAKTFLQKVEIPELISSFTSRLAAGLQLEEEALRQTVMKNRQNSYDRGSKRSHEDEYHAQSHPSNMAGTEHGERARLTPLAMRDKQIMMYAVRYPHRLEDLQNLGADLALNSDIARRLWNKIKAFGPDEVLYQLDERENRFWAQSCTGEAPPRDDGEKELQELAKILEQFQAGIQKNSLCAALRENAEIGDFEKQLDYLRVLQQATRKKED